VVVGLFCVGGGGGGGLLGFGGFGFLCCGGVVVCLWWVVFFIGFFGVVGVWFVLGVGLRISPEQAGRESGAAD